METSPLSQLIVGSSFSDPMILQPNVWTKIWKHKAPYKYKTLLWNIVHVILPTTTIFKKKISSFDPTCHSCGLYPKFHLHLFRDCFHASILWKGIIKNPNFTSTLNLSNFLMTNEIIRLVSLWNNRPTRCLSLAYGISGRSEIRQSLKV